MAHVRIKRAITYIALGATTGLGTLVSTRAWAADGIPSAAPRAMSAPPPLALTLPELLSLPSPQALEPPTLSLDTAAETGAPADMEVSADAQTSKKESSTAEQQQAPSASALPPLALPEVIASQMHAPAQTLELPALPTQVAQAPLALDNQTALPVPEALIPQVNFWKRVYTEVDSKHGFIHDAWHLDVIYNTVDVPSGSRRQSARSMGRQVSRVATLLRQLARGSRNNPTVEEAQILAAWPKDVSNATLLEAARNVRFQTGQSDKFKAGLVRARTWTPFIESTFTAAGLPRELAALPHVESSFNMHAFSKVRAAGIWQFMPATARLFMHMDGTVDERLDPIRSTESAAHLLAQNYRLLGSWPLAITAYNHGPQGVHRAMTTTGSNDLAVIIGKYKTKHFGFASRNFYTELLAAWDSIAAPGKLYFGQLPTEQPLQYETVTTDAFYHVKSISAALGVDACRIARAQPRPKTGGVEQRSLDSARLCPSHPAWSGPWRHVGNARQRSRKASALRTPIRGPCQEPVMIASHHPYGCGQPSHSARRFVAQRAQRRARRPARWCTTATRCSPTTCEDRSRGRSACPGIKNRLRQTVSH